MPEWLRAIRISGLYRLAPAKKATTIFTGNLRGYLDEDALALVQDGTHMFTFTNLRMTETSEESKALNMDPVPKVIISASGMCDAGRIRHHLKHNLWRKECTVVFVGYQGEGTLGRALLEGAKSVKMFGEEIAVNAEIENFHGLSSHADRDHLLEWISNFKAPKPQHVFVVHGDREVAPFLPKVFRIWDLRPTRPSIRRFMTSLPGPWWSGGICPSARPSRYPAAEPVRLRAVGGSGRCS